MQVLLMLDCRPSEEYCLAEAHLLFHFIVGIVGADCLSAFNSDFMIKTLICVFCHQTFFEK